ncbi:hypothetical protein PAPYR_6171 [Paratrimastix pyriformis]|uniref:Origin recognition complex subunit 2 RecA-like domain-containing protein n=1 Tax=Paratrimastix pyriformis TaxID=342808 RepID=A0ABQ8UN94_9EUKA|nr:hypothetical protein PAPYR_6171 [Paratrimastix pyriformis]
MLKLGLTRDFRQAINTATKTTSNHDPIKEHSIIKRPNVGIPAISQKIENRYFFLSRRPLMRTQGADEEVSLRWKKSDQQVVSFREKSSLKPTVITPEQSRFIHARGSLYFLAQATPVTSSNILLRDLLPPGSRMKPREEDPENPDEGPATIALNFERNLDRFSRLLLSRNNLLFYGFGYKGPLLSHCQRRAARLLWQLERIERSRLYGAAFLPPAALAHPPLGRPEKFGRPAPGRARTRTELLYFCGEDLSSATQVVCLVADMFAASRRAGPRAHRRFTDPAEALAYLAALCPPPQWGPAAGPATTPLGRLAQAWSPPAVPSPAGPALLGSPVAGWVPGTLRSPTIWAGASAGAPAASACAGQGTPAPACPGAAHADLGTLRCPSPFALRPAPAGPPASPAHRPAAHPEEAASTPQATRKRTHAQVAPSTRQTRSFSATAASQGTPGPAPPPPSSRAATTPRPATPRGGPPAPIALGSPASASPAPRTTAAAAAASATAAAASTGARAHGIAGAAAAAPSPRGGPAEAKLKAAPKGGKTDSTRRAPAVVPAKAKACGSPAKAAAPPRAAAPRPALQQPPASRPLRVYSRKRAASPPRVPETASRRGAGEGAGGDGGEVVVEISDAEEAASRLRARLASPAPGAPAGSPAGMRRSASGRLTPILRRPSGLARSHSAPPSDDEDSAPSPSAPAPQDGRRVRARRESSDEEDDNRAAGPRHHPAHGQGRGKAEDADADADADAEAHPAAPASEGDAETEEATGDEGEGEEGPLGPAGVVGRHQALRAQMAALAEWVPGEPWPCSHDSRGGRAGGEAPVGRALIVLEAIDAPALRSGADQYLLSMLAGLPFVHIIASLDHVGPSGTVEADLPSGVRFRWVRVEAATAAPYPAARMRRLASLESAAAKQLDRLRGALRVAYPTTRAAFGLLVRTWQAHLEAAAEAKKDRAKKAAGNPRAGRFVLSAQECFAIFRKETLAGTFDRATLLLRMLVERGLLSRTTDERYTLPFSPHRVASILHVLEEFDGPGAAKALLPAPDTAAAAAR